MQLCYISIARKHLFDHLQDYKRKTPNNEKNIAFLHDWRVDQRLFTDPSGLHMQQQLNNTLPPLIKQFHTSKAESDLLLCLKLLMWKFVNSSHTINQAKKCHFVEEMFSFLTAKTHTPQPTTQKTGTLMNHSNQQQSHFFYFKDKQQGMELRPPHQGLALWVKEINKKYPAWFIQPWNSK